MEGIAPPLRFVLDLELALESGASVRSALYRWLQEERGEFASELRNLLVCFDGGRSAPEWSEKISPERKAVFELVWRGLGGEPLLNHLRGLREEIELAANLELDDFMAKLPMRALIPLLLLIFPGFMVLLFGPLIVTMMKGFIS